MEASLKDKSTIDQVIIVMYKNVICDAMERGEYFRVPSKLRPLWRILMIFLIIPYFSAYLFGIMLTTYMLGLLIIEIVYLIAG